MILEMIIAELIRKSSKFRALARSIGQEEPGCQIRDRGCGGDRRRTSQARGDGEHEKDGMATAGCGNFGIGRNGADRLSDLVCGYDVAFGSLSRTPAAILSAVAAFPTLARTGEPGSGRRGSRAR